jgi:hypothetical protein
MGISLLWKQFVELHQSKPQAGTRSLFLPNCLFRAICEFDFSWQFAFLRGVGLAGTAHVTNTHVECPCRGFSRCWKEAMPDNAQRLECVVEDVQTLFRRAESSFG